MSDSSITGKIVPKIDVTATMSAHTAARRYINELLEKLHQATRLEMLGVGLVKGQTVFAAEHNVWVLIQTGPCVRTETFPHTAACSVGRVSVFGRERSP